MNYKLPIREIIVQLIEDRGYRSLGRGRERLELQSTCRETHSFSRELGITQLVARRINEDKILSYTFSTAVYCQLQLEDICLIMHFKTFCSLNHEIIETTLLLFVAGGGGDCGCDDIMVILSF